MWHKDTKWVNAVGKIASIDAGLPQTFYLLKKKKKEKKSNVWSTENEVWYLYVQRTISHNNFAICDNMDWASEVSQTEKDKYHMIPLICEI